MVVYYKHMTIMMCYPCAKFIRVRVWSRIIWEDELISWFLSPKEHLEQNASSIRQPAEDLGAVKKLYVAIKMNEKK